MWLKIYNPYKIKNKTYKKYMLKNYTEVIF